MRCCKGREEGFAAFTNKYPQYAKAEIDKEEKQEKKDIGRAAKSIIQQANK